MMPSTPESETAAADPHRSSAEFADYYAERHEKASLVARFASDRQKVTAFARERLSLKLREVLDVGCGPGAQAMLWAADGAAVSALDINGPLIEVAKRRAQERGLSIDFRLGSATALPWPDASFDACMVPELLEHVAEWQAVLDEVSRVVRPGGLLYLSTTNALCPRQEEFTLPAYSWYPGWLKRRYERLAVTTRPEIANHATYPAVNWFTPYELKRELKTRGVTAYDRFDILDVGTESAAKKAVATACRALPPVRFLAHCFTPSTMMLGVKDSP